MKALKNFLLYNNTVPLLFGVLFLGTTATFAASPEAREVVISSEETLTSIDNSYIRGVNLNSYDFETYVTAIEENNDTYYVSYTLTTIALQDGVWQPVSKQLVLEVAKEVLADNDLGTYVSKQLADIYTSEVAQLKETQLIENQIGVSEKVVTKKYAGLIGKMLDPKNKIFPGYKPVVIAPAAIAGPTPKKEKPTTFETTLSDGNPVVIINPGPSETVVEPDVVIASSTTETATTTTPVVPDVIIEKPATTSNSNSGVGSTSPITEVEETPTEEEISSNEPAPEPTQSQPAPEADSEEISAPEPPPATSG